MLGNTHSEYFAGLSQPHAPNRSITYPNVRNPDYQLATLFQPARDRETDGRTDGRRDDGYQHLIREHRKGHFLRCYFFVMSLDCSS